MFPILRLAYTFCMTQISLPEIIFIKIMERENMRIKDEPMFLLLSLSYMQAKEVGSFV